MLLLDKRLHKAKTAHEKTAIQRQMETTDRRIDDLLYEVYGLADEEIRLVEKVTQ